MTYSVCVEWQNDLDEIAARDAMTALCEAYPGHPWHVDARGGVLIIKHMRMSPKWGMVLRLENVHHDAAVLKRRAVLLAGEFLERANTKRGRDEDNEIWSVEGIPFKDLARV